MPPIKTLIVEDNSTNQILYQRFSQKLGWEFLNVDNGLLALQELSENKYDLILMDLEMPEMDGITAIGKIRAGESGINDQNIPIIAMTAHAMPQYQENVMKSGANHCLFKPFSVKDLKACAAELFDE